MYCKKCGRFLEDASKGCPICDAKADNNGSNRPSYPETEAVMGNGMKVTVVAVTLLVPVVGLIFGFIMAIVSMGRPETDYRSFGKALLVLCFIMLGVYFICCIFGLLFFYAIGDSAENYYYYDTIYRNI